MNCGTVRVCRVGIVIFGCVEVRNPPEIQTKGKHECNEKKIAPFGFSQTSLRLGGHSCMVCSHNSFFSFPNHSAIPVHPTFIYHILPSFHCLDHQSHLSDSPLSVYYPLPDALGGSLFFLPGGDGHQLLGSFGDVISALDDLLGQELVVHRAGRGVRGGRFTTLDL